MMLESHSTRDYTFFIVLILLVAYQPILAINFSSGSGEPNDPYQINNAQQLIELGETPALHSSHFILTEDIDLDPNLPGRKIFKPSLISFFSGVFNGNGHIIHNLHIDGNWLLGAGLFGSLSPEGKISKLGLEAVNIKGDNRSVSGLVGWNDGYISYCYCTGSIIGDSFVGGLAGGNEGIIKSCYSQGQVEALTSLSGGLVGMNHGDISTSYSTCRVTGERSTGGFCGKDFGQTVTCVWDIETSGIKTSQGGVGLSTSEMKSSKFLALNGYASDPNWILMENLDYPHLLWEGKPGKSISPASIDWLSGTGSHEDPYRIEHIEQLTRLRKTSILSKDAFILCNNLDLSGVSLEQSIIPFFDGTFDGNDHLLRNLHLKGTHDLGFFSRIGPNAHISNLTLLAVDVNGTDSSIGGLAGRNEGTILSCACIHGTIHGKNIDSDDGLAGWHRGGLVGWNLGCISSSYSHCIVEGYAHIGGLVGHNTGSINKSSCYSITKGNQHIGGLVGNNRSQISLCYSTGTVTGNESNVGGLVGSNSGDLKSCYSEASCQGGVNVGGLVGENHRGSILISYSRGIPTGWYTGGLVGRNFKGVINRSIWDIDTSGISGSDGGIGLTTLEMMHPEILSLNGFADEPNWILENYHDYPRLAWEETPGNIIPPPVIYWLNGNGTPENPYVIKNEMQLIRLSKASGLADKSFSLEHNLDLSGIIWPQAVIPTFYGTFDGNGHCIKNVFSQGTRNLGFFGYAGKDAIIKNLYIKNVEVKGGTRVGGLIGCNEGEVSHCRVEASIDAYEQDGNTQYVGGLVGKNYGSINASSSSGTIYGTDSTGGLVGVNYDGHILDCYSLSNTSNSSGHVGGLLGYNSGVINRCYSTGEVTTLRGTAGGLVGGSNSSIYHSFWDIESSGLLNSEGGTGVTTAMLHNIDTFINEGWDITRESNNSTMSLWIMPTEPNYPILQGE